jgi:hypothetical protein
MTPETPTGPEAGRSNEKEEEPVSDARTLENAKKVASEEARDAFFAMLDELKSFASAPDPGI